MDDLPQELLCNIIGYITEQKDRKSLCEVSRRFNDFATPFLYNSITLNTAESDLGFLNVKAFSEVSWWVPSLACAIEDAEVEDGDNGNRLKKPKKSSHWDLERDLISILQQLEDNTLLSFSWDLGICIPSTVLGRDGILTTKQRRIECLALTTGGSDEHKIEGSYLPYLLPLNCLRSLSWKSIITVEELYELSDGLLTNSEHLSTLELDLVDFPAVLRNWRECGESSRGNLVAFSVLNLERGQFFVRFPVLEVLRLSQVPFNFAAMEMACALNLTNLRSLKLHNCPGSFALLETASRSLQPIRLTSFELVSVECFKDSYAVSNFLEAFTGLEELYLYLRRREPEITGDYWPSIRHHMSSLKRLVYHIDYIFDPVQEMGEFHLPYKNTITSLPLVDCVGIRDSGYILVSFRTTWVVHWVPEL
ncbi:hypothetical protein MMC26_004297 [Xylographa opegraphella]|nr:hypothetical protein [Xylographa opegraphella]